MVNTKEAMVGYANCALWSSACNGTAPHEGCPGEDCDKSLQDLNYGPDEIDGTSWNDMQHDVDGFVRGCEAERADVFNGMSDASVGCDFWLTRNGHGAGFWDRGLGERGDWLTKMAKPYGDAHLYVDDDDSVRYQS